MIKTFGYNINQGNRTNRTCVCVHTHTHTYVKRKIYVKKLAHMIVEMWQAQNPQDGLADRKPREAAVQVQRQTSGRIPSS